MTIKRVQAAATARFPDTAAARKKGVNYEQIVKSSGNRGMTFGKIFSEICGFSDQYRGGIKNGH